MINLNMNAEIHRSLRQVFSFVTAPENDFQWQYGTFASARIPHRIGNIGIFFRSIGHLVGRRNLSTFEVTEFEPNKKYGFKSLSGLLDLQTTYTLERAGGGTKINISIQANVLNFGSVEESILEKMMEEQLKENLERLKALLESKHIMLHSELVLLAR
jgi:hypothetical protein